MSSDHVLRPRPLEMVHRIKSELFIKRKMDKEEIENIGKYQNSFIFERFHVITKYLIKILILKSREVKSEFDTVPVLVCDPLTSNWQLAKKARMQAVAESRTDKRKRIFLKHSSDAI